MPHRTGSVEEQLQHIAAELGTIKDRLSAGTTGEHGAGVSWRGARRWLLGSVALVAAVLWWVIYQSGWNRVTPRDEITRLNARVDTVKAATDALARHARDITVSTRFLLKLACRTVRDSDLVDQCADVGLRPQPPQG